MARTMDINIRIERQEKKILKLRAQLEEAQDIYDKPARSESCLRISTWP